MTDSPFMDGYSSEEYDDVDSSKSQHSPEVASSALDIESDHEVGTAVDGQALQETEKAAEEDVNQEFPEELGATFVPEIAASEENVIQDFTEELIKAPVGATFTPGMAVEEDVKQEVEEELGAPLEASLTQPATLTTPTPMDSAWEESVPIEECEEYETVVVIEGGSVVFKGDTMVRNWVHWLLFQTAQCLQACAREFMRFCRFAAASLRKSMMNQHEKAKDC